MIRFLRPSVRRTGKAAVRIRDRYRPLKHENLVRLIAVLNLNAGLDGMSPEASEFYQELFAVGIAGDTAAHQLDSSVLRKVIRKAAQFWADLLEIAIADRCEIWRAVGMATRNVLNAAAAMPMKLEQINRTGLLSHIDDLVDHYDHSVAHSVEHYRCNAACSHPVHVACIECGVFCVYYVYLHICELLLNCLQVGDARQK